jgi:hypothetical protein
VTFVLFEIFELDQSPDFSWSLSINTGADPLSHWIVAYTYIKVILELNALLDKDILLNNSQKIKELSDKKRSLTRTSVVAVTVCVVDGAICYYGFLANDGVLIVGTQFGCVLLDLIFLAVWGYALVTLSKKVKHERLIPNRRMFVYHGICLVSYVFFNLIFLVALSLTAINEGENLLIA